MMLQQFCYLNTGNCSSAESISHGRTLRQRPLIKRPPGRARREALYFHSFLRKHFSSRIDVLNRKSVMQSCFIVLSAQWLRQLSSRISIPLSFLLQGKVASNVKNPGIDLYK